MLSKNITVDKLERSLSKRWAEPFGSFAWKLNEVKGHGLHPTEGSFSSGTRGSSSARAATCWCTRHGRSVSSMRYLKAIDPLGCPAELAMVLSASLLGSSAGTAWLHRSATHRGPRFGSGRLWRRLKQLEVMHWQAVTSTNPGAVIPSSPKKMGLISNPWSRLIVIQV